MCDTLNNKKDDVSIVFFCNNIISYRGRNGIGDVYLLNVYWLRGCRFGWWRCWSGLGILGCCGGRREGRVRSDRAEGAQAVATSRVARVCWPRRFGWLVALGGYHAAGHGSQLRALLDRPEMVALLAASPAAGRALRPLCRALGIEASVYRPGFVPKVRVPRVRKPRAKRAPVDWGRIPLPRGVLAAAKRQGFGKRV